MQHESRWFDGSAHARWALLMVAVFAAMAPAARGQLIKFNFGQKPAVPVTIKHPASLEITLAGRKVAFGPIPGGCAQQFADLVMQDFAGQGVTPS
jgi:hypothetical protein